MDENAEVSYKEQAEQRKFEPLDKEKLNKLNEQTEYKSGMLIRLVRIIRDNPDLLVLGVIVITFCLAGYWLAKIHFGMTTEQIKVQMWDFIEFTGIVLAGVIAVIGKIFMAQGTITQSLSKSAGKEADASGRTLIR